jgi:sucrose-phosphate synthase
MTEHPDFGGQLIYVKEICLALARMGIKVDIVTRLIDDPDWPEFSKEIDYYEGQEDNLRIVRIPCGGPAFLRKEDLWEHMDEFTDNIVRFYGSGLPRFSTAHYGDGGYCGVLLKNKTGIGFTFTGHSLGAQKLDKLGMKLDNFAEIDGHFFFSKRIQAERLSMKHAYRIITSTMQERLEQYAHPLYQGAVSPALDARFSVIPPGVNTNIFNREERPDDANVFQYLSDQTGADEGPFIIASSRFDEKKNPVGLVKAFALSPELNQRAKLCIVIRGIDESCRKLDCLSGQERGLLNEILETIADASIRDRVFFLNLQSQQELASAYRYFAKLRSVFALTAFYEPFGLAPIEAAACGLAVVATKNGGPSEVFKGDNGVLVDPFDPEDIAQGLLRGIKDSARYAEKGYELVESKYTWKKTAESYLNVIEQGITQSFESGFLIPELDASALIMKHLS